MMENTVLIRKDKPSTQILIISFFIQLFGIILISSSDWIWWQILIGTVLLFSGLTVIALKSKMLYDSKSNSLIVKWKSFMFSKSQKVSLPEIDHIAIVRVNTSRDLNLRSIAYHESGFKYNLNFIFKNSKERFRKLGTMNKKEAFRLANELSEKINKPILDNSTPEKKWINK